MGDGRLRFRQAAKEDATALAELINFAGEGMPLYLWGPMAEPGESAWDVGRRRAQRDESSFSYRNGVVAEYDGKIAGNLVGYALAKEPQPIDYDEMLAMFVPLQELENLAPDSWYVNVVAVFPEFRGKGIGTELLHKAETLAKEAGKKELSLIVSDANSGAERLYARFGFARRATRPMVKNGWVNPGKNWVLMTKPLGET